MSAYKDINCLISQPKHYVVGNQKNRRNGGGGERCQNAQVELAELETLQVIVKSN